MKYTNQVSFYLIRKLSIFLFCFVLLSSCSETRRTADGDTFSYTDYMDPFIGSGSHGHVFVGANVPFGAVQLGPTILSQRWDCFSDGKTLQISTRHNSQQNKYIRSIVYNGKDYTKSYIRYNDLMAGEKMVIEMEPEPSKSWGLSKESRPYSGMN